MAKNTIDVDLRYQDDPMVPGAYWVTCFIGGKVWSRRYVPMPKESV